MRSEDLGKLVLRVTVGGLLLLHGIGKITGGIDGIVASVEDVGLPGELGYGVYVGEVLAPILVVAGALTRPAAIVIAINMAAAVALAHPGDLATLTGTGGWALELQGLYFSGAVAVALLGPGSVSASRGRGRYD